ncbi:MAG TPA: zinc ribbon domain-containing protein [Thermoplasmata archaeon]|nr:zinc ribbon domain-containing protein [Thermoplasmata archaeon]
MQCPRCGTPLPDNARFCYGCGAQLSGAPPPPPPPGGPVGYPGGPGGMTAPPPPAPPPFQSAPAAPKDLKCPSCGAPLQPELGDAVLTCQYCGATVSLAGTGWKPVNRHTMLLPQLVDPDSALKIVRANLDQGMFHSHRFEDSKITDQKFQFVPYWIVPSSATTNYTYEDVAVAAGSTVGTMAVGALLGGALTGGRGNTFMPIMAGPVVNPMRQEQITGSFQFPVVAVKGYTQYQPKNYQFNLDTRTLYKKDGLPGGATVLNGDLGEEAAQQQARAYVTQVQAETAHKKHRMVSQLQTQVEVGEPELVHVPIWYFALDRKGEKIVLLVDANAGRVMLSSL